ncbi:MAG: ABC transporter permease [Aestuariivita sp.]|nr:ABC transporter permease [Aestuariivita sp.]MCY4346016.1 ABC transporter permease [Aestuariivita sp.]
MTVTNSFNRTSKERDAVVSAGPMLAADGTPLKKSLARALRVQKMRALLLIAPLLVFVLISFIAPIVDMLFRSVENQIVSDILPETVMALETWDGSGDQPPAEMAFEALYLDLFFATEKKLHTRLGSRLNYEITGAASLFRKTGRRIGRFGTDVLTSQIVAQSPELANVAAWQELMGDTETRSALPLTARTWDRWTEYLIQEGDDVATTPLEDIHFAALYFDLRDGVFATNARLPALDITNYETVRFRDEFASADDGWLDVEFWRTVQTYSPRYTPGYFLNAVDLKKDYDGIQPRPESQQIYVTLFGRTLSMSLVITLACLLLGYPVSWLLANLPARTANLLLILVLLPFWTSLLVRTSAWKVMLQQQGVVNDTLVWLGFVDDASRLIMMNNQTGTIIAMTHILLPFMILPLYSVMKTIPPSYVRAAKSLGATNWTAFWRVYFPQSVPGIGAGSILVFILAIGYYITPEIVGGTSGIFISNRIAYHISSSLNWGLAAALGTILLVAVLVLYWVYDRVVGIDNVKLGG